MANWLRMCANVINEYCLEEFGHEPDYSDLTNVGLAFTTVDDDNEVFTQVSVDLVHYTVTRWESAPRGNSTAFMHSFATLPQLYNWLCGSLDFEWLVFHTEGRWYTDANDRTIRLH